MSTTSGCGGNDNVAEMPTATLGSSVRSERELRPLIQRWRLGIEKERLALDGTLAKFVERHRDDKRSEALVPLAQVYRAFNALTRSELERARELAQRGMLGPPGATRDLAVLAVGAAARRSGDHLEALARLEPLQHKMLDAFATDLLNEELVAAALGAGDFAKALRFMEVWRRELEAGGEAAIDARIAELLESLPRDVLTAELERRRQRGLLEEGVTMATAIARRLARYAQEFNDADLARLLLRHYGPLLGGEAVAVARLSAERSRSRVSERTVGFVMSLKSPWQRRRSAEVAAGLAHGLGLPGSQALLVSAPLEGEPDASKRTDPAATAPAATAPASSEAPDAGEAPIVGEVPPATMIVSPEQLAKQRSAALAQRADAALRQLAAQGASVVVGGVDSASAQALAEAADRAALPVLLLSPGARRSKSPFVFFVGENPAVSATTLHAQLSQRGASRIALIGDDLSLQSAPAVAAQFSCANLPDSRVLKDAAIDALLLLDGSYCYRPVSKISKRLSLPLGVGLGIAPRNELLSGQLFLSAGAYPLRPATLSGRLKSWSDSARPSPSWWAALGRDAAVLAWEGVKDLSGFTSDRSQVTALRLQVTSSLATARVSLWTSDSNGFDSQRSIRRTHQLAALNGR